MTQSEIQRFPNLVFGGGGTRCFWHGGFLGSIYDLLAPTQKINAVSGGALSALAYVTKQEARLLDITGSHFDFAAGGPGNMSWARRRSGGDLFIHQVLYRTIVSIMMDNAAAVEAIAEGPQFTVQLAKPSRYGALATVLAYAAEVPARGSPHVRAARRMGAVPVYVDARQAAREGRFVDLVVAAASSPPVFDQLFWDGVAVIDGGVVDNAFPHEEGEDQLIMVTRPYPKLPVIEGRTYAKPSRKIATNKLDFTDRAGIEAAWKQGMDDGAAFRATLTA